MNDGRLDRVLLLAILAALGGLYWQLFSMNQRLTSDIANVSERLSSDIANVSERLARVETRLEYVVPPPADPAAEQSPGD